MFLFLLLDPFFYSFSPSVEIEVKIQKRFDICWLKTIFDGVFDGVLAIAINLKSTCSALNPQHW